MVISVNSSNYQEVIATLEDNMILTDIQAYLAKNQKVSLADLSTHFRMSADTLSPMLERLLKKGRIRLISLEKCGGCSRCSSESMNFYEWVDSQ